MTIAPTVEDRHGEWWVHDPRPPRRPRNQPRCQACGTTVTRWDTTKRPDIAVCCGRLQCRAQLTWTIDQWEGKARMAASRARLGLPLTGLDRQALHITKGDHV